MGEWRSLHFALLRDALRYVSRNHRWYQLACFKSVGLDVSITLHFTIVQTKYIFNFGITIHPNKVSTDFFYSIFHSSAEIIYGKIYYMDISETLSRINFKKFRCKRERQFFLKDCIFCKIHRRDNPLRLRIKISKVTAFFRVSVINIGKPLYRIVQTEKKRQRHLTQPVYANMLIYRTFALLFHQQLSPISFLSPLHVRSYTLEVFENRNKHSRDKDEGNWRFIRKT